jgi:hypothetical protein
MPQKDTLQEDNQCALPSPLQEMQNAAVVNSLEQRFLIIKQAILDKIHVAI